MAKDGYFDSMSEDEFFAWMTHPEGLAPDAPMTMLLGVRLPVDLVYRLDLVVERDGTNRADVLRDALTAYLADRVVDIAPDRAGPHADAA
jgi:predicted transcriptional regulator